MNELSNANHIKALFIDLLLDKRNEGEVIGSEIMFAEKKALADLVLLSNKNIMAYEIKAQNDDFRKAKCQLETYNKVFDYVSLITTEKHFLKAKKQVPSKNGIIIVTNKIDFEHYREPKQNISLRKEEILSTMTIKFILEYFNLSNRRSFSSEIRKTLRNRSILELKSAMYTFLYKRILNRFSNFVQERGMKTHYEDITLLSMPPKKITL
jgi:hypothetical protein